MRASDARVRHQNFRVKSVLKFITSTHTLRINNGRVIPIKIPDVTGLKDMERIVNKILAITKDADYLQNPAKQAQMKQYEKQIDQMVDEL